MSRSKKRKNRNRKRQDAVIAVQAEAAPEGTVSALSEAEIDDILGNPAEETDSASESTAASTDSEKEINTELKKNEGIHSEPSKGNVEEAENDEQEKSITSELLNGKRFSGRKELLAPGFLSYTGKIALKLVLLGLIFLFVWTRLTPYFREDRNKDGDLMRNLPSDSIDVVALGSSHMQYAFNPGVFYAESGYYSYVFGSVCQPFSESYYLLKEILKTQHPSVVVIDVFTLLPQSQVCYADGTYYIAMDMMSGSNRVDAADAIPDSVDEDVKLGYTHDLYMNHGNWKTMDFSDMNSIKESAKPAEGFAWSLGYVAQEPVDLSYTPLIVLEPNAVTPLKDEEKAWIDKIDALCKENDIHLIFIKTPYIENQQDANKLAAIWNYCSERKIEYIDFLEKAEELGWFINRDGDTWHNNTWGAEIVTKELARVIQENRYVRTHKANNEIQFLYDDAVSHTAAFLMKSENDNIYRLLDEAKKYPSTVLVRYKGGNHTVIGEFENQALQDIGLTHDFIADKKKDYYAVVKDGKLVKESNEPFDTTAAGNSVSFTEEDILVNGVSLGEIGDMQIIFCDDAMEWVNPISIDYKVSFWKMED